MNKLSKAISILFILISGCIIMMGCSNPHTPAGNVGYVFENPRVWGNGGFRGVVQGPGNFGVSLWRNQVINVDYRPLTYRENFKILAKDDLNVSFKVEAILKFDPNQCEKVVKEYGGSNWYNRYVKEPFRSFVRNTAQNYTSQDLKGSRKEISTSVTDELREHIKGTPFQLVKLVVGNIDYPAVVEKAVEKKLAAQQLLQEKETQKEIAKRDAEIKIEEAKGIAESQKIINATLTANYLQHEAIQAQLKMASSPNHTTVYIPSGPNGIPIIRPIQ